MSLPAASAPLRIRLAAELYELFLLAAVWVAVAAIFTLFLGEAREPRLRIYLQLGLLAATTAYLAWSWTGGRRTLAMRTWRLALVTEDGGHLGLGTATVRALLALVSVPTGLSLLWALVDRDRRFLHDRIARTRLVRLPPDSVPRGLP